ncbi:N-acetylneuraminate lyase-like [Diorhabda sublineata]|uniref:N-acetylneuraminate lyase-like n=1 Tax=Diorhabda sublineata TaxID=1163346 RepID=UPI0024E14A26|nr:N-acetylneuraminate lyase-like [Diorhabda sublineata]
MNMEAFEIGSCFRSYNELMEKLNEYCEATNTKFTTKDSRLITNEFATAKESFVYSELKLICVYGRTTKLKEQNRKRKMRTIRIPKTECPAYFRIKLLNSGVALQIVAMNTKHNHVCEKIEEPEIIKKKKKLKREIKSEEDDDDDEGINTEAMEASEFIEVYIDPDDNSQPERKVKLSFKGLCVPVFNMFRDDLSLKVGSIAEYAEYLSGCGIKGVIVNGCAGEGMSMTVTERKLVAEEWISATRSRNMHVMVQISACPLPDVQELTKHAEMIGADSILCIPELYYRPSCNDELADYLKIISDIAPKTPLIYSHNPEMTAVDLNMIDFVTNYAESIPTFCGIEFVSNDVNDAVAVLKASNGKYKIFFGTDSDLSVAISNGFDAAITPTGNLYPNLVTSIMKSSKHSKSSEARRLQKELIFNLTSILEYGFWVSSMKVAMNFLAPFNVGICRPPLRNLSEEDVNSIKEKLITAIS